MGNISTVTILHDYVGTIDDKLFLATLHDMLRQGKTGEVVPGVTITDFRHLDYVKNYNIDSNDVEQLLNRFEASHKSTTAKAAIVEIRKLIRGLVHEHSHS